MRNTYAAIMWVLGLAMNVAWAQHWSHQATLTASDFESNAHFGYAVDIEGDYVAVGAPTESKDASGGNVMSSAGAVYIYRRAANGQWQQTQKLVPFDREAEAFFGYRLAMSGPYLVVGAYKEDQDASAGNPLTNAGAAYVYRRDANGTYQFEQKIVASDRAAGDYFGFSVAIDGTTIVVGAPTQDYDASGANLKGNAGAVYVFEKQGNTWVQTQKLVTSDRQVNDWLGKSVAIHGNYIVAGAPFQDYDVSGANSVTSAGALYVFQKTGNTWVQIQKLVANNREMGDYLGDWVAISGHSIAAGAPNHDLDASNTNSVTNAGAVFIFDKQGGGWVQSQKIVANDRQINDYFGFSFDLENNTLVVGANRHDYDTAGGNFIAQAGAAYFFEKTPTGWVFTHKVVSPQRNTNGYFGRGVAMSGIYAVIGADGEAESSNPYAGHAYIFRSCRTYEEVTLNACRSFTSPSGKVWTTSGTYRDTIPNAAGCDSVITFHLTIEPGIDDTSVVRIGHTLMASLAGATYQWVDCQNGYAPIAGATGRTFTPTASGSYAVILTKGSCSDTSGCHTVIISGVAPTPAAPMVTVYPTASDGWVMVAFDHPVRQASIEILDAQGRQVVNQRFASRRQLQVELPSTPGIYTVRISTATGQHIFRVMRRP